MKQIALTKGQFAIVDDEDFKELNKYKWHAFYGKYTKSFYARKSFRKNKKKYSRLMHREIMGAKKGEEVDHSDHNTLNNQKYNLRICTRNQNQWNQKPRKNTTSIYKGVDKNNNRWCSRIRINGITIHLGSFKDEKEAARAYNKAAKKLFKEFAYLNKIE